MKSRGFSLIELLVVIAIIAVLSSILIASMQNSRQHAKAVICQSNIKQSVTALILFDIDNESFPLAFKKDLSVPAQKFLGEPLFDQCGFWWINYISDYSRIYNINSIFKCPAKNISSYQSVILHGNYGVNQAVCKIYSPLNNNDPDGSKPYRNDFFGTKSLSAKRIKHPASTILIADSGFALVNWRHACQSQFDQLSINVTEDTSYIPGMNINFQRINSSLNQYQLADAIDGRHPQKTLNVGFIDGHVERKKADDLIVEQSENSCQNRSPLWLSD